MLPPFLNLLQRPLMPCVTLRVFCSSCGVIKMTTDPIATGVEEFACPKCGEESHFLQQSSGTTTRSLPFWAIEGAGKPTEADEPPSLEKGLTVVYVQEPGVLYLGEVEEIYTDAAHVLGGKPSLSLVVKGELTEPIPYFAGVEVPPYWCYPGELPKGEVIEWPTATRQYVQYGSEPYHKPAAPKKAPAKKSGGRKKTTTPVWD